MCGWMGVVDLFRGSLTTSHTNFGQTRTMDTLNHYRKASLFVAFILLTLHMGSALAQMIPSLGEAPRLAPGELEAIALASPKDVPSIAFDPTVRSEVTDAFRDHYATQSMVLIEWSGNLKSCLEGATSERYREATIGRVNYFRAHAGLPSNIALYGGSEAAGTQKSALVSSANKELSHSPPSDWACWTQAAYEAAGRSNLALGIEGPDAINAYMDDYGTNNAAVGHRRWILYPPQILMDSGSIPSGSQTAANALWVIGGFGARPANTSGVAWPPRGFVPWQILPIRSNRWSFSWPGADFSRANIAMKRNGMTLAPPVKEAIANGYGDNTLVWRPDGVDYSKPGRDTLYTVTITGATGNGVPETISYEVVVIDPYTSLPDSRLEVTVYGEGQVTSNPTGIACGNICSATFQGGSRITLTATPAMGYHFGGWSGACAGTGTQCVVPMDVPRSVLARFVPSEEPGEPSATLWFDGTDGPSTKAIERNSGTPVTFAWATQNVSGHECRIRRRPDNAGVHTIRSSTLASGTYVHTTIHAWQAGDRKFYLECTKSGSPTITSHDIILTITEPGPTRSATLRFDTINGPTDKTLVYNSGKPVTFAWQTRNLSGYTCKILRAPDNATVHTIPTSALTSGNFTSTTLHGWQTGDRGFYLNCSKVDAVAVVSPSISLKIIEPEPDGYVMIDSGQNHVCALTTAGQSMCKGENSSGAIGDGTTTSRDWFVAVSDLGLGQRTINAGGSHTCSLSIAGEAWCWGTNTAGQLGNGGSATRRTPIRVSGLESGTSMISAGHEHTCAVTAAGGAVCWGNNEHGQLGNGGSATRRTPVQVSGLDNGVQAISTGRTHTCALVLGAVKCWGSNVYGQLGNGGTATRRTPVRVSGLGSGVKAISVGGYHSCALTGAGSLKCWGRNRRGQLGDGTNTTRRTPVQAIGGLGSGVTVISAGDEHTCAVTGRGVAKCWGADSRGQLGGAGLASQHEPTVVPGLNTGVQAISAGESHTCALTDAGRVKCWGSPFGGETE